MTCSLASLLRSSLSLTVTGALAGLLASACDLPDKHLGDDAGGTTSSSTGGSCDPADMPETPADCNTCSCVDGEWFCAGIACIDTDDAGSSTGGTCDPLQDPSDDCNTCACIEGEWLCTAVACPETTTGDGFDCDPAGDQTDECGTCECLASGEWQCTDSCSHAVEICQGDEPNDPLFVTDATLDGDVLHVTVQHGGGCGQHEYGSCWDGGFAESDPVQAYLQLSHLVVDDPCDAIVTQTLVIDLVPLRDAWIDAYQQPSGTIALHVADWGTVDYAF